MKKQEGGKRGKPLTQKTKRVVKVTEPQEEESWRTWVLTTVALGFALLVITLLTQKNAELMSQAKDLETEIAEARAVSK